MALLNITTSIFLDLFLIFGKLKSPFVQQALLSPLLPINHEEYISLPIYQKTLAALSTLPSTILFSCACFYCGQVLAGFEQMKCLTIRISNNFLKVGLFVLTYTLVSVPEALLNSFFLTMHKPEGQKFLEFSFSTRGLIILLFAGFIIVMGIRLKQSVKI